MNLKQNNALSFYLKCRNVAEVSKKLGISEATLHRYKKTYDWDTKAKEYDESIKNKIMTMPKNQNDYRKKVFGFISRLETQMDLKINISVSEINAIRRLIELDISLMEEDYADSPAQKLAHALATVMKK